MAEIKGRIKELLEWPADYAEPDDAGLTARIAEVSDGTAVFQDSGDLLAWTDGYQILIRCGASYAEQFREAFSGLAPAEFFEASHIAFMEGAVREDGLLLAGPYLVFFSPEGDLGDVSSPCEGMEIDVLTSGIEKLYSYDGFSQALAYVDEDEAAEEVVVMAAEAGAVVGIASAVANLAGFLDIGIEVLSDSQQRGIGSCLLNRLTKVISQMGKTGTYIVSPVNVSSVKLAVRAGYQLMGTVLYTI